MQPLVPHSAFAPLIVGARVYYFELLATGLCYTLSDCFSHFLGYLMCKLVSLCQPAYTGYLKSVMIRCANVNLIVTDLSYPEGYFFTWQQHLYKNSSLKRPTYSESLAL